VTQLLAIEDLGRGSSGKAWLCSTTSTRPSICVLKFSNKAGEKFSLEDEKQWWHQIYPEFASKVKVEEWSGSSALVMPHFTPVPESRRPAFERSIRDLLTRRFGVDYIHKDVRWRNIGYYLRQGEEIPVLFDLESVKQFEQGKDDNWIDIAMMSLYN
jgi:hypothetical protein